MKDVILENTASPAYFIDRRIYPEVYIAGADKDHGIIQCGELALQTLVIYDKRKFTGVMFIDSEGRTVARAKFENEYDSDQVGRLFTMSARYTGVYFGDPPNTECERIKREMEEIIVEVNKLLEEKGV